MRIKMGVFNFWCPDCSLVCVKRGHRSTWTWDLLHTNWTNTLPVKSLGNLGDYESQNTHTHTHTLTQTHTHKHTGTKNAEQGLCVTISISGSESRKSILFFIRPLNGAKESQSTCARENLCMRYTNKHLTTPHIHTHTHNRHTSTHTHTLTYTCLHTETFKTQHICVQTQINTHWKSS